MLNTNRYGKAAAGDDPIDFVIMWVDGNDPAWREDMLRHLPQNAEQGDAWNKRFRSWDSVRFRSWDNLRYWFRAVETCAPWVRKVHFVTWGHHPEWLNFDCPKLHFVRHEDFIPKEYLPTFSARPIELNFHRIEGLSESFVFFDDDMFLLKEISPDFYFREGCSVHPAVLRSIVPMAGNDMMSHTYVNMVTLINRHFNRDESLKANAWKWFSPLHAGLKGSIQTLSTLPYSQFTGFANEHLPVPMHVSTMQEVWEAEHDVMHETCLHKFRSPLDVNQYVFRYWELASGRFYPIQQKDVGRRFSANSIERAQCVADAIQKRKYRQVCINDGVMSDSLAEECKEIVNSALRLAFPHKSGFEL